MASQNIPRAVSVLTLGNKVMLYCIVLFLTCNTDAGFLPYFGKKKRKKKKKKKKNRKKKKKIKPNQNQTNQRNKTQH